MAGAGFRQGAGAVSGAFARHRSRQRLRHLQCTHQPSLYAADGGAVPLDHPGLDRQRQEPLGNPELSPSTTPSCSICPPARSDLPGSPSTATQYFGLKAGSTVARRQLLRLAQYRRGRLARSFRIRRRIQRADILQIERDRGGALRQLQVQRHDHGQIHLQRGIGISPGQQPAAARLGRHRISRARFVVSLCRTQRFQFGRHGLLPVPARRTRRPRRTTSTIAATAMWIQRQEPRQHRAQGRNQHLVHLWICIRADQGSGIHRRLLQHQAQQ